MIDSIDGYVAALRRELDGADPATIQDAVADASAHLSDALATARATATDARETDVLREAIEAFGTPAEVAGAYREVERRTPVAATPAGGPAPALHRFVRVYQDLHTWGSLLYMILIFPLGIGYLIWTILGVSFSISFAIFIVGIPLALAFLLSLRGIALLEGRLIEALLGVRMPRRALLHARRGGTEVLAQIRSLVTDPHTWLALLYASTLWLVGTAYFIIVMLGIGLAGGLITAPLLQEWLNEPVLILIDPVWVPRIAYPLVVLAGVVLLTAFLHLVRGIGRMHGRIAKRLLVGDPVTQTS